MKVGILLVLLLAVGLPAPSLCHLLESNGFAHLVEKFEAEDIGLGHIVDLTNAEFSELGVVTIGGRHNLRAAARVTLLDPEYGGNVAQEGRREVEDGQQQEFDVGSEPVGEEVEENREHEEEEL